jgi:hypothetical protein
VEPVSDRATVPDGGVSREERLTVVEVLEAEDGLEELEAVVVVEEDVELHAARANAAPKVSTE